MYYSNFSTFTSFCLEVTLTYLNLHNLAVDCGPLPKSSHEEKSSESSVGEEWITYLLTDCRLPPKLFHYPILKKQQYPKAFYFALSSKDQGAMFEET